MTTINAADISYAAFLSHDEVARQRAIRRARAYASGAQFVALTDRLRSFLADPIAGGSTRDPRHDADLLRLNVCHTVVQAVAERMIVARFASSDPDLAAFADATWGANRMDARADDAHQATIRDGESFVAISWDSARGMPLLTPHPRYVAATGTIHHTYTDGVITLPDDGYGIRAYYADDDDQQPMACAVKRWHEVVYTDGSRSTRPRHTVYYPDRIEKYVVTRADTLTPVRDDPAEPWPLPWVDAAGVPLGIPIVHMKNPNLQAEAWEAIPLQNAINKTLIDLLAASDMSAFRLLVAIGFDPRDANGQPLPVNPGSWIGTANPNARVESIPPASMDALIAVLDTLVAKAAQVTDTPVSRFVYSKAIASADTQKQQDSPLLAKIRKRQTLMGNAWEDAITICARLAVAFGGATLDTTAAISTQWEAADVRDDDALMVRITQKAALGIPRAQLWRELGYSDDQIATWQADAAVVAVAPLPPTS